jgi:uncharacterized integral membrane protein (TIGR00698 family)
MKRTGILAAFTAIIVLALLNYISSPVALILGFLFTLVLGNPFAEYSGKTIHILLKVSVIGLGFGMSLTETIKASKDGFTLTALSIFLTVSLGLLLIKRLQVDKKLGFLMTSGTAICGGSAIAAITPVIKANYQTVSIAIGVVFLLNSIALLIFPGIGHLLNMTQTQFGLWCAVAIHDTSSVVGAALVYGDKALQIATTVKLARTLWIIPLSFFAMMLFKTKNQKIKIPVFILGFIAAMLLNTYHIIPQTISFHIVDISKRLLVVTLFLVGTTLTIKDLSKSGLKPVIFSTTLWVFISNFSLSYILWF